MVQILLSEEVLRIRTLLGTVPGFSRLCLSLGQDPKIGSQASLKVVIDSFAQVYHLYLLKPS